MMAGSYPVPGLFSGEVELRDAELEVEPVKKLLAGTLPYTLEVQILKMISCLRSLNCLDSLVLIQL